MDTATATATTTATASTKDARDPSPPAHPPMPLHGTGPGPGPAPPVLVARNWTGWNWTVPVLPSHEARRTCVVDSSSCPGPEPTGPAASTEEVSSIHPSPAAVPEFPATAVPSSQQFPADPTSPAWPCPGPCFSSAIHPSNTIARCPRPRVPDPCPPTPTPTPTLDESLSSELRLRGWFASTCPRENMVRRSSLTLGGGRPG